MNKLNTIKKHLTIDNITFLNNINQNINVDKSEKNYFFKIFGLNFDQISNFIYNIRDEEVVLIEPFISIKCNTNTPYLTLSEPFLVTNNSTPDIIQDYLYDKIEEAGGDFEFDHEKLDYFLFFKHKRVYFLEN